LPFFEVEEGQGEPEIRVSQCGLVAQTKIKKQPREYFRHVNMRSFEEVFANTFSPVIGRGPLKEKDGTAL
jgi:hypothetical protein